MRKTLAVTVGLALVAATAAVAADIRRSPSAVPGEYIVVLRDDAVRGPGQGPAAGPSVPEVAAEMALTHGGRVDFTYQHALRGFAMKIPAPRVESLARDRRIAYVEENGRVWASTEQSPVTWGLDRIDQRDLPLNNTYVYNTAASNVHAYIIDTGIRLTHNEFGGRAVSGYDAIDGGSADDCNGHGTHVAGTVGGATYGVAKQVQLVAVRVLNCQGSGTYAQVIAGVDWVTANQVSPAVANMSLGGPTSGSLDDAIESSIAAGVTYAVAAGNENQDACNVSPARVDAALTVGATTSSDVRSSFSNWGTCVDIFAPGSSITSAWYTSDSATNTISGTSMASPHVAGVAALYLADNPSASPATVFDAVIDNATSGRLSGIGSGSPNLLLYSIFDGGGPGDDPPVASFSFSCNGLTCSFDGGGSSDDNGITGYAWTFGDGASGSGETTAHTYSASGTYQVTLTVTDTAGQSDSETQPVSVSDGGGGPPCTDCEHYTGTLSGADDYDYHPNGTYYNSGSGTHRGWLRGPAGTDFDLYLWKWSSWWGWYTVAQSISSDSEEEIIYNGTSGYYVWRVESYSGSGAYDFWMQRP